MHANRAALEIAIRSISSRVIWSEGPAVALSSARRLVRGDLLRVFECAAVLKVGSDTGGAATLSPSMRKGDTQPYNLVMSSPFFSRRSRLALHGMPLDHACGVGVLPNLKEIICLPT